MFLLQAIIIIAGDFLMCVLQAILNALELFDGLVGEGKLRRKKR